MVNELLIKGIQKTTLIDYPDNVASIIFVGGCNFRCPFCYNRDLVLNPDKLPTIPESEVLEFLEKRQELIDGIVVSGGEPTTHQGLPGFIEKVKKLGLRIKLDTNGANPKMLEGLIEKKMVDYIAMDIKSSPRNYEKAAGVKINFGDIEKSAKIIMNSGIDYEFRTTIAREFFSGGDFEKIGQWLKGAKKYCLQQFVPMKSCLDPKMAKSKPFTAKELEEFRELGGKYFRACELRGV